MGPAILIVGGVLVVLGWFGLEPYKLEKYNWMPVAGAMSVIAGIVWGLAALGVI